MRQVRHGGWCVDWSSRRLSPEGFEMPPSRRHGLLRVPLRPARRIGHTHPSLLPGLHGFVSLPRLSVDMRMKQLLPPL